jgi:hypothetical protein
MCPKAIDDDDDNNIQNSSSVLVGVVTRTDFLFLFK